MYSFPELPPHLAQSLEQKFFQTTDDLAARALQIHLGKIIAPWTDELVSAWTRFLIALQLRHPDAMRELRAYVKRTWHASGDGPQREYERIRGPGDPETFDEHIAMIDPDIPGKMHVNLIAGAMHNVIVGECINKMRRAILSVENAAVRLLTCDRPVLTFNLNKTDGSIVFPISPTKIFAAANDPRIFDVLRKQSANETVSRINTYMVERARLYVWASDETQEQFIRERFGKNREPIPLLPSLSP